MLATEPLTKAFVRLAGDLDLPARASTQTALEAVDADVVIIDMTAVRFIDGGALGLLVELKKRLRLRGRMGIVKIVTPDAQFKRLFRITGLTKLFDIHDSIPDAQAA